MRQRLSCLLSGREGGSCRSSRATPTQSQGPECHQLGTQVERLEGDPRFQPEETLQGPRYLACGLLTTGPVGYRVCAVSGWVCSALAAAAGDECDLVVASPGLCCGTLAGYGLSLESHGQRCPPSKREALRGRQVQTTLLYFD